ncbi:hypothetical protein F2P56_017662 [Juglans regia]|uniref:Uncharacterized protein LOC108979621 n=2 Tax=Juglans regia TaxID=51240 RepID=A0A2I4DFF6_JUGRE|nr:uncharacterized protein LOC108979621 [Juglans regia]XP_035549223.1 uncharacterized protein LOC118349281 [Juglans regia]KAF5461578.1 hypothetical protein F2P56_017659 [Juglans regia]KAF5461581.1 hypothetical protein F2P56_017662 [Juglans regia]
MGIKKWWNLDSETPHECIQLGRSCVESSKNSSTQIQSRWKLFWKKTKSEKKFPGRTTPAVTLMRAATYDSKTYSKNFDQGTGWMDPDNLSRSFSARFADPSRVLRSVRMGSLLD